MLIDGFELLGRTGPAVFDTGAAFNSIMLRLLEPDVPLGGRRQRLHTLQGRLDATFYSNVAFAIQGVQFPPTGLLVLPREVEWASGRLVSGTAFENFQIDFAQKRIELNARAFNGGARGRYAKRMHFLEVGDRRGVRFLIDTGSYTSRISVATLARLRAGGVQVEREIWELSESGNRPAWVRFARLPSGTATLQRPAFEIVDEGVIGRGKDGILGLENLASYDWCFDRSPAPLDFKPNGVAMPAIFVPGLTTVHDAEGGLITKMIIDGPAMRAGLRLGDRLVALNGEAIDASHVASYQRQISTSSPTTLRFDAMRSGQRFTATFQTEEII